MPPIIIIAMAMLALVIIALGALAFRGSVYPSSSKKVTVYTTVMGQRMKCTFDENGGESWSRF